MSKAFRGLVSKKKVRFQEDGFDLDLTYITPHIIAMGFPSTGTEAAYRNPMDEVQRFFEERHKDRFLIVNLCSERKYDHSEFDGHVLEFPFDDHNAPPFNLIPECVQACADHLGENEDNVVAIHCKAGKGRTGVMVSCLLQFLELAADADAALELFGEARTSNGKGVTIPSQQRFVQYYGQTLKAKVEYPIKPPVRVIERIHVTTVPSFDLGGGCDPYFQLYTADGVKFFQSGIQEKVKKKAKFFTFEFLEPIAVRGDIKVLFWDWDRGSADDEMFWFWFNTYFEDDILTLDKTHTDGAVKDKRNEHFEDDFSVEVTFGTPDNDDAEQAALEQFEKSVRDASEQAEQTRARSGSSAKKKRSGSIFGRK